MMRKYYTISLLCFIFILTGINVSTVSASHSSVGPIELTDMTEQLILDNYIEILIETDERITLDQVVAGKYDNQFTAYTGKGRPNFGYHRTYYWVRFDAENLSQLDDWLLEVDAPKLNHAILYFYNNEKNRYESELIGNIYEFTNQIGRAHV